MEEPVDQIARLEPHLAILKIENESIQALAAARPRNHEQIKAELMAQIDAYPSFAKAAIYCKPVGGGKFARNLSIRAAEGIAEAYGFNRVRCDVTPVDEDHVKIEATFTDFQKGRIWQDGGVLSKWYKSAQGKMVKWADDRFYSVVVKAEASRRIREVILRSVPPGLRSELMELAEKRIDLLLDDASVSKIVAQFANKGVTLEQLEKTVGRTLKAGWTKDDRKDLLGIWNAVESGEMNLETALNGQPEENRVTVEAAPSITQGATVETQDKPFPETVKPTAVSPAEVLSPSGETAQNVETVHQAAEVLEGLFQKAAEHQEEKHDPIPGLKKKFEALDTLEKWNNFPFDNKEVLKTLDPGQIKEFLKAFNAYGEKKGFKKKGA
jgi:hypothetical protein